MFLRYLLGESDVSNWNVCKLRHQLVLMSGGSRYWETASAVISMVSYRYLTSVSIMKIFFLVVRHVR